MKEIKPHGMETREPRILIIDTPKMENFYNELVSTGDGIIILHAYSVPKQVLVNACRSYLSEQQLEHT